MAMARRLLPPRRGLQGLPRSRDSISSERSECARAPDGIRAILGGQFADKTWSSVVAHLLSEIGFYHGFCTQFSEPKRFFTLIVMVQSVTRFSSYAFVSFLCFFLCEYAASYHCTNW